MLSTIPKILGRRFIIGFFLPSALFYLYIKLVVKHVCADMFDCDLFITEDFDKIISASITIILISIILLALNRRIIRLLEGYGSFNPLKLLLFIQKRRFRKRGGPIFTEASRLDDERKASPKAQSKVVSFGKKLANASAEFPHDEKLILATKFGNTMRAFEAYSFVVYSIDAVAIWPRLFMIIPKNIQNEVNEGMELIDFNANLFVLAILMTGYNIYQAVNSNWPAVNWLSAGIPVVVAVWSWLMLPVSAREWGELVKSVFDLHRSKLAKSLELEMPPTASEEREMWGKVSRMMLYRSENRFRELDPNRLKKTPTLKNKRADPQGF